MAYTLEKLAHIVDGELKGDSGINISGAAALEKARKGEITFIASQKYLGKLDITQASAILIQKDLFNDNIALPCILVDNIYLALSSLLEYYSREKTEIPSDKSLTYISEDAEIGEDVEIGVFSVVDKNAVIGDKTRIHGQVYVGPNVRIGENCEIYPGVKIYGDTVIGHNVIIHGNAIIGSDGFGFAPGEDGKFIKIPQIGNVILEDNVEIGANTVIDRASLGSTIIREGTKLDNLIQIAHNVEIGKDTVIAAQAGVAGSTRIGSHCQIGGQAGIVGHISIADNTRIQAQSGMTRKVSEEGTKWYGSPAIEYNNYLKSFAIYKNLPDLQSRITELENLLTDMQQKLRELYETKNDTA